MIREDAMLPATRPEAIRLGAKYYFNGNPCKYGHISKRTASGEYRKKNRVEIRNNHKRWRDENPEKIIAYNKKWRAENPEKCAEMDRSWNDRNRWKKNAHRALRRTRLEQRTPDWADLEAINFFYECCPKGCHVDHIVPIQGRNVSGLHVAENLQWLPATENLSKSNKWN
jgi:hypothetical protein